MDKIKIGIIGCGNISDIYLQNLTSTFVNTEVLAVCDIIEERAQAARQKYNIPYMFTNVDEILGLKEIQIIVNLTTPGDHYQICKKALEAGKHVYVEKPLSLKVEQGMELKELARKNNLLLGCAPDTFLGAGLQTCRKAIDDGLIGDVIGATAFMVCHGHESWHPDPEFYYEEGGGPMFDMGPYYLTALVSMIGPAKTVTGMNSITFKQRTITSRKKFGKVIDVKVPTHVTGTIEFKNGAIATVITSFDVWGSTLPRIEIYGSRGTLIVPDPNTFGGDVRIQTYFQNEFKEVPLTHIYSENSRGLGVADMADAIINNRTNIANGDLACHVLEIMHAFHESAEKRAFVDLKTDCERPKPLAIGLTKGYVSL
ncbi:oxidoreductase [Clostridium thermosuccinogenes]|mgnify:CR=1 FL=1|uniref:Oxidoreductase n=1 Tax=Clostridium thermosuccinogenes TaxID=84032 RepID=A0A2K2FF57_9CLOT|nr:Gfo/Idh/MocA family oxidoreductase [Pseudoclostridium thermosuccinogenes]AUS98549.1 oxidoreductase [Pseudoclostridium thermosuccinogenes]PNT95993.1 oxidoreductase [Pseudoclostridium thermosuccinogenes]PNT97420.1 oxidoreductase [Pseudoclostridium thermosuccinogenes]